MSDTPLVPCPEHLTLFSAIISSVARARRLSRDDAQDFSQFVHVRCLERNYDLFRRFDGRSSLRTYLTVVVRRLLLDWRNGVYGKWRSSAAAVSLGEYAINLERLIARDGHTPHEAVEMLRLRSGAPSAAALLRLCEQLPVRMRPRPVSDEVVLDQLAGAAFEDPIETEESRRTEQRTRTALAGALRRLSIEDRWLIRARYHHGRSVQAVAQSLQTDPKALYRRFDRVLGSLRDNLRVAGVTRSPATGRIRRPQRRRGRSSSMETRP